MEKGDNGHVKSPVLDAVKSEAQRFEDTRMCLWGLNRAHIITCAYFEDKNTVCGRSRN